MLDNLETLLEEGADTGRMRPGYEGYERLLRRAGELEHQSCLLFTSREKPVDLIPLEEARSPVRSVTPGPVGGQALRTIAGSQGR